MAKSPLSSLFSSGRETFVDDAIFSTNCAASVDGGGPLSPVSPAMSTHSMVATTARDLSHCQSATESDWRRDMASMSKCCLERRDEGHEVIIVNCSTMRCHVMT